MLLYAEHTWGHSSTITHPYESMVLHLDMRKNGYASDAHEAASRMMQKIRREKGEICTYYGSSGTVRVCPTGRAKGLQPVEFYLENPHLKAARVVRDDGKEMTCQIHTGSRGQHITFLDCFEDGKAREYTFTEQPFRPEMPSHRHAYIGSERVKDIISDYDPISCFLPYQYENEWFRLAYRPGEGVTEFVHKASGKNMLAEEKSRSLRLFMNAPRFAGEQSLNLRVSKGKNAACWAATSAESTLGFPLANSRRFCAVSAARSLRC